MNHHIKILETNISGNKYLHELSPEEFMKYFNEVVYPDVEKRFKRFLYKTNLFRILKFGSKLSDFEKNYELGSAKAYALIENILGDDFYDIERQELFLHVLREELKQQGFMNIHMYYMRNISLYEEDGKIDKANFIDEALEFCIQAQFRENIKDFFSRKEYNNL